jgi:predicted nucleic acid-binding protein
LIYSDTSSFLSMLIERRHSREINKTLILNKKKVVIWKLTDLELHCAMKSMVTNKEVEFSQTSMTQALHELHHKENINQVTRKVSVDLDQIFDFAIKLTDMKGFNSRSLDTIHVASAKAFKCTHFLSTDKNQRSLAKKEGFIILPEKIIEDQ